MGKWMICQGGDLPESEEGRLKNMEHVVLKWQNLQKQLNNLDDGPPIEGRHSISDLLAEPAGTDPLLG